MHRAGLSNPIVPGPRGPVRTRRTAAALLAGVIVAGITAVLPTTPAVAEGTVPAPFIGPTAPRHLWVKRTPMRIAAPVLSAPAVSRGPSGVAMPTVAPTGWRLLANDDFNRSELGSRWTKYSRPAAPDSPGAWDPSHVVLRDGKLVLVGNRVNGAWTLGGVSFPAATTTYGKYELRMRMDASAAVKHAALLWPTSGRWPLDGEIDFSEDGGGARQHIDAHLHWGADNLQLHRTTAVDLTQWHTVGVEWLPGRVNYTLDGAPWSSILTPGVPSSPMDLAVQIEAVTCAGSPDCTSTRDVLLELDWVSVYARA
jgi:hypothetical protein